MEAWLDEMSAIYDKEVLIQLYHQATDKPYGFLYIKVNAKDKKDTVYDSLQNKLAPTTIANDAELILRGQYRYNDNTNTQQTHPLQQALFTFKGSGSVSGGGCLPQSTSLARG